MAERVKWTIHNEITKEDIELPSRESAIAIVKLIQCEKGPPVRAVFDEERHAIFLLETE